MDLTIGLMGFGTVGRAVYTILNENKDQIEDQLGRKVSIKKILVRDLDKYQVEKDFVKFTDRPEDIVEDDDIDLVIELTGSVKSILGPIRKAIKSHKNIITANKALVSKYMEELTGLARQEEVKLEYEAAVGGAIPIINPLRKIATLNDVESIEGVLNGSCNFILSDMAKGRTYKEALKKAQDLGFAEADPSDDVEGLDTMRKLRILASIAFKSPLLEEDIELEGITGLSQRDVTRALKEGYSYKLIARADLSGGKIRAKVSPERLRKTSPLAQLDGGENMVIVRASNLGEVAFKGLGAGGRPTAFSVLSDLINIYAS